MLARCINPILNINTEDKKIYKENVFRVYGRVQQALVQLCGKSLVAT